MQAVENFFARDLGGEQAQGHVRNLIFRIKPRAWRHQRGESCFEFGDAVAAQGRDHESLREGERVPLSLAASSRRLWRFHRIDLVEDKNLFGGDVRQAAENGLDLGIDASWTSTSNAAASASPVLPQAAATMARSSRRFGANMPGVSTKMICALPSTAIPRTELRVV